MIPYQSTGIFINQVTGSQQSRYNATIQSNGATGIGAGYTELYNYQMKYPTGNASAPFQIAFESSSLHGSSTGLVTAVIVKSTTTEDRR